jgi:hypothetical protein
MAFESVIAVIIEDELRIDNEMFFGSAFDFA